MQKYRFMLIFPFVILIIIAFGTLGSGDDEEKQLLKRREDLIARAEELASDEVYFRAAECLENALNIKVGDDNSKNEIELKLLEYYSADNDPENWLSLEQKRINNASASESEVIQVIEYYRGQKKFDMMLSVINSGLSIYPGSEEIISIRDSLIYSYSYSKLSFKEKSPVFDGKIAICSDGKWGYVSHDGSGSANFLYDDATSFCNNYAAVCLGGKVSLINNSMKRYSLCHDETVDGVFIYDGANPIVTAKDKYLLCNYEMEVISEPYDFIGAISDGLRPAQKGGKWIFLYENGEESALGKYDDIAMNDRYEAFFNGIAFVSENGSYRMINTEGETLNDAVFEDAYPFIEKNSYAAVKKDGKWGFTNRNGEIVIPCNYDDARSFSCGLAAVKKGGQWGYISYKDEFVIPAEYSYAEPFYEKRAFVQDNDGYGTLYLDYYE